LFIALFFASFPFCLQQYSFGFSQRRIGIKQALLSCGMGCPQRAELPVFLDDIGEVERGVFLGCLDIGMP
jgi:hypothetical protein